MSCESLVSNAPCSSRFGTVRYTGRKVTRKKNRHYRKRAGGVKLIKSREEDARIDPGRDRKQIEPRNPSERLGESEAGASQRAKRMRLGSATPEEMKRCDADDNDPEADRLDFGNADGSAPPEDVSRENCVAHRSSIRAVA